MDAAEASGARSWRWQHGFVAFLFVLVVIVSLQYGRKIENPQRSAFARWRPQVLRLHDEDIYARYEYPNPPIMALILLPFAALPLKVGAFAWFYFKLGLTVLTVVWTCRLVTTAGRSLPAWAVAVIILLSLRPIMGDLGHGNVNLFIVFLVVGALYGFHRGKDFSAGIILALSIACKVTPALFIGYFLWKRAWRTLAGTAVGLVAFLLIVPASYLGFGTNVERLGAWYRQMVVPYVVRGFVTTEHQNQSLPGVAMRLLTHSPSDSMFDEQKQYHPTEYRNLLNLDPRWVRLLVKGCMAAFAVAVVLICRTSLRPRQGWRLAAEYSLILLGMLLFSERTWKHHCVTLLLPFAVLVYHFSVIPSKRALRIYLLATLVGSALLMASTITGLGKSWSEFGKLAEVYGAYVWACLLLAAGLVVVLGRGEMRAAARGSEPTDAAPRESVQSLTRWQQSA